MRWREQGTGELSIRKMKAARRAFGLRGVLPFWVCLVFLLTSCASGSRLLVELKTPCQVSPATLAFVASPNSWVKSLGRSDAQQQQRPLLRLQAASQQAPSTGAGDSGGGSFSPQDPTRTAQQKRAAAASVVTTLEFGRCRSAPRDSEQLLQQYWCKSGGPFGEGRKVASVCAEDDGGVARAACVLYSTSWDVRSQALSKALEELALAAAGRGETDAAHLARVACFRVQMTNSLIIARGKRAVQKQVRMARNQKQLRHHEFALRLMLQEKVPIHLEHLPVLLIYYQRISRGLTEALSEAKGDAGFPGADSAPPLPLRQALEVRTATPSAILSLKNASEEFRRTLFQGEEQPPLLQLSGGDCKALPEALAEWLGELGALFSSRLEELLEKRMQQAREQYPIYRGFNLRKKKPINPFL